MMWLEIRTCEAHHYTHVVQRNYFFDNFWWFWSELPSSHNSVGSISLVASELLEKIVKEYFLITKPVGGSWKNFFLVFPVNSHISKTCSHRVHKSDIILWLDTIQTMFLYIVITVSIPSDMIENFEIYITIFS